ncbi:YCF48-related protein [Microbulbifer sp. CAU 1566]|uniref:YCF48-related protein n=1 Tax=Microbulbifer sp. CAU 1566 TaxID=2933269 RepID=UPI002002B692|nr:YCF48-related protein [Microbulbifer sp. CAU 1566]MCK7598669.1 YCF48-related protein [Microbulbifer sp. CAU 1566]
MRLSRLSFPQLLLSAMIAAQPLAASAKVELLQTPALQSSRAAQGVITNLYPLDAGYLLTGERGLLLQWQSDGQWQQLDSPVSVGLTSVATLAGGSAVAVGHDAAILHRSRDGDWQKVFDGYDLTRLQIAALESRRDQLQQQIDNPEEDADIDELGYQLEELEFALEDTQAELESGPNKPLLDVVAASDQRLFATGAYGTLLRSDNGGESWQLASAGLDNPDRFHLNAITRGADGSLYIVGESGTGFASRDGGDSWEAMELPYDGSLFGIVSQAGSRNLVAFGLQGHVLISRDDGNSWQHHQLDAGASLLGGTIDDRGRVVLVGHGGLVASFSIAQPDDITVRKHPSGAAFSAVAVEGEQLILAGQFGVTAWHMN